jgi:hypothetical protein
VCAKEKERREGEVRERERERGREREREIVICKRIKLFWRVCFGHPQLVMTKYDL